MNPVHIVAVLDNGTNCEALYVAGELREHDHTIYMCDLVRVAEGRVIEFSRVCVGLPKHVEWPKRFEDLMQYVKSA